MAKVISLHYVKQLQNQPNWQLPPYSNVMAVVSKQEKIIDMLLSAMKRSMGADTTEARLVLEGAMESVPEEYTQKLKGIF